MNIRSVLSKRIFESVSIKYAIINGLYVLISEFGIYRSINYKEAFISMH